MCQADQIPDSASSKPRTPTRKSSIAVLSPRLFSETSPSASTSKGLLITGMGVPASRSCSNSAARGSPVPEELTRLLSPLHVGQLKSRRQFECGKLVFRATTREAIRATEFGPILLIDLKFGRRRANPVTILST